MVNIFDVSIDDFGIFVNIILSLVFLEISHALYLLLHLGFLQIFLSVFLIFFDSRYASSIADISYMQVIAVKLFHVFSEAHLIQDG